MEGMSARSGHVRRAIRVAVAVALVWGLSHVHSAWGVMSVLRAHG